MPHPTKIVGPANLLLSNQSGKTAFKVRDVTNKRKHSGRNFQAEDSKLTSKGSLLKITHYLVA